MHSKGLGLSGLAKPFPNLRNRQVDVARLPLWDDHLCKGQTGAHPVVEHRLLKRRNTSLKG